MYVEIWTKHPGGRPPKIETPEELWEKFIEYAIWVEKNPLYEQDFVGKDATEVERRRIRPLLKPAAALHIGFSRWEDVVNQKSRSPQFSEIVTRIESCINSYNITGAASGFLNANIIARVEGLKEQTENEHKLPPQTYREFMEGLTGTKSDAE